MVALLTGLALALLLVLFLAVVGANRLRASVRALEAQVDRPLTDRRRKGS